MAADAPTPAKLQALIVQLQTLVATLTSGAAPAGPVPSAVILSPELCFPWPQVLWQVASSSKHLQVVCVVPPLSCACLYGVVFLPDISNALSLSSAEEPIRLPVSPSFVGRGPNDQCLDRLALSMMGSEI
jgi:hypothetical protein